MHLDNPCDFEICTKRIHMKDTWGVTQLTDKVAKAILENLVTSYDVSCVCGVDVILYVWKYGTHA